MDSVGQEMTLEQVSKQYGESHRAYKEYNQLIYELDKARADRDRYADMYFRLVDKDVVRELNSTPETIKEK